MLDKLMIIENKVNFYEKDVDNPYSVNGFKGTWNISKHAGIPDVLLGFLQRHFGLMRLSRVKMEEINKVLNDTWEGPGSLKKLFMLEYEMEQSGKDIKIMPGDIAKMTEEDDDTVADTTPLVLDFSFEDEDE